MPRLTKFIQIGLLAIAAIMPFHAFLSIWVGSIIGHQTLIQGWKEVLTVILLVLSALVIIRDPNVLQRFRQPIFYLAGAFIAIAVLVTLIAWPDPTAAIFGVKIDIEFLVLFGLAYLVADKPFLGRLTKIILISGIIAASIGIVLSYVLPPDFLKHFGYGAATILPYQLIGPEELGIRTPSTLGGPNQFGAFLILPLCLSVALVIRQRRLRYIPVILILIGGIGASYSRSAWLGAALGIVLMLLLQIRSKKLLLATSFAIIALATTATVVSLQTIKNSNLSYYLLHEKANSAHSTNSTEQHQKALESALEKIADHPWGSGLGSAGPASFQGGAAYIPESYYLQLALETGIFGLIAFMGVLVLLGIKLLKNWGKSFVAMGLLGALVGISIVNVFLHGWADSSTAFVFWILAGAYTSLGQKGSRHDPN